MSISRPIRTRCRLCGDIFGGGYAEEFGNGVCHDCLELLVDASLLRTLARFSQIVRRKQDADSKAAFVRMVLNHSNS